ncbi:unnamed protein product, partial [marine sediment metagenome]
MAEMTQLERIITASHKKRADRLPFVRWHAFNEIGWAEREC